MDLKADDSPVTKADREVESALRAYVAQHLPDHGVIGEEEADHQTDARFVWVFDPIDGTRSFMAGRPTFTTLIALCENNTPILGIIDQPIVHDRWVGCQGMPSTLNGHPIHTRPCPVLDNALLATTSPHYFSAEGALFFENLRSQCRDTLYGGDAYLYGLLASGHIDVICEEGLKFFDIAALLPIIEGAGGKVSDWHGQPLSRDNHATMWAVGDGALSPTEGLLP